MQLALLLGLGWSVQACSDDDGDNDTATGGTTASGGGAATGGAAPGGTTGTRGSSAGGTGTGGAGGSAGMSELTLTLMNTEPLGDGFVYEGWLIVDDMPVSTGRFEAGTIMIQ